MNSIKLCLLIVSLFCFLACSKNIVRVKLENNTNEVLTNIKIRTSSRNPAKHKKSKFDFIKVDSLDPGQVSEVQLVSFLNFDCLSLQSDTKQLRLKDCMSDDKVKSGNYKILIGKSSLTWNEDK